MERGWEKKIQVLKRQDVEVHWGSGRENLGMVTKITNVGKMLAVAQGMVGGTSKVLT